MWLLDVISHGYNAINVHGPEGLQLELCQAKSSQIHNALLSGRVLCQCGLTDGGSVPDEGKERESQRWFGEVEEGTYDVVIYMSYCWWHIFKFFFFNICCWFRFEDMTSPHPLDDAQGFSTQWSSCNTPGFLRLSGPHPLLLCQWPPGLQEPCSFHRRSLLGRRLPCLWLEKKSHLREGNKTLPWRSYVSPCTASSAMSPWTQRSKPRLIIR